MTAAADVLILVSQTLAGESYTDLLRSGPHWLFELTVELLSAPLAFAAGWVWRTRLLHHVHRDLHSLARDAPRRCVEATPLERVDRDAQRSGLALSRGALVASPARPLATSAAGGKAEHGHPPSCPGPRRAQTPPPS